MMLLAGMMVLLVRSVSYSSLFLMISSADDSGTAVNKAVTSSYVMHSPPSSFVSYFICKLFCVVDMVNGLANIGFENSS